MFKKLLVLFVLPALILVFAAGCADGDETEVEEPEEAEEQEAEENGEEAVEEEEEEEVTEETFHTASEADENGYVTAEVTFEGDEIVNVELAEFTDMNEQKGDDYGLDEWHEAMEELPGRFEEANSAEVDKVSGATSTSEKAMDAVEKAIARAEGETDAFDGTFIGSSEISEDGWGVARVTLEDEEITEVQLDEVQFTDEGEAEYKDEDYGHDEWHEAREELAEQFVEQDDTDVDTYSGATGSSEMWIEAVEDALETAGK